MTHPERQGWSDDRILLVEESDDGEWTAYASPDAEGEVFLEDICLSGGSSGYSQVRGTRQNESPFPFDIVFHNTVPQEGEVEPLVEEIGERFASQFDQKVDEVYELLGDDDPLGSVMDLEPKPVVDSSERID